MPYTDDRPGRSLNGQSDKPVPHSYSPGLNVQELPVSDGHAVYDLKDGRHYHWTNVHGRLKSVVLDNRVKVLSLTFSHHGLLLIIKHPVPEDDR